MPARQKKFAVQFIPVWNLHKTFPDETGDVTYIDEIGNQTRVSSCSFRDDQTKTIRVVPSLYHDTKYQRDWLSHTDRKPLRFLQCLTSGCDLFWSRIVEIVDPNLDQDVKRFLGFGIFEIKELHHFENPRLRNTRDERHWRGDDRNATEGYIFS